MTSSWSIGSRMSRGPLGPFFWYLAFPLTLINVAFEMRPSTLGRRHRVHVGALLLQKNVRDRQRWLSRRDLRLATITWSEGPTTVGDGKDGWENSHPSNMKQSTGQRSQWPKTPSQQKPGQSRVGIVEGRTNSR